MDWCCGWELDCVHTHCQDTIHSYRKKHFGRFNTLCFEILNTCAEDTSSNILDASKRDALPTQIPCTLSLTHLPRARMFVYGVLWHRLPRRHHYHHHPSSTVTTSDFRRVELLTHHTSQTEPQSANQSD